MVIAGAIAGMAGGLCTWPGQEAHWIKDVLASEALYGIPYSGTEPSHRRTFGILSPT